MIKIRKDSFLTAIIQRYSSILLLQLSGFIIAMFVSKFLGPELLGYYAIFQIITSYFVYSNLGATNGLSWSLGVYLGAKDHKNAKQVINTAHSIQYTSPLFLLFILILTGLFLDAPYSWLVPLSGIFWICTTFYQVTLNRILAAQEKHHNCFTYSISLYTVIGYNNSNGILVRFVGKSFSIYYHCCHTSMVLF